MEARYKNNKKYYKKDLKLYQINIKSLEEVWANLDSLGQSPNKAELGEMPDLSVPSFTGNSTIKVLQFEEKSAIKLVNNSYKKLKERVTLMEKNIQDYHKATASHETKTMEARYKSNKIYYEKDLKRYQRDIKSLEEVWTKLGSLGQPPNKAVLGDMPPLSVPPFPANRNNASSTTANSNIPTKKETGITANPITSNNSKSKSASADKIKSLKSFERNHIYELNSYWKHMASYLRNAEASAKQYNSKESEGAKKTAKHSYESQIGFFKTKKEQYNKKLGKLKVIQKELSSLGEQPNYSALEQSPPHSIPSLYGTGNTASTTTAQGGALKTVPTVGNVVSEVPGGKTANTAFNKSVDTTKNTINKYQDWNTKQLQTVGNPDRHDDSTPSTAEKLNNKIPTVGSVVSKAPAGRAVTETFNKTTDKTREGLESAGDTAVEGTKKLIGGILDNFNKQLQE